MIKKYLNAIIVEEVIYSSTSERYLLIQLIVVGICYRSPTTNFEHIIHDLRRVFWHIPHRRKHVEEYPRTHRVK